MRRAFSLPELTIGLLIFAVLGYVIWALTLSGLKQLDAATGHQTALRDAVLVETAIARDLRALAVLNDRRQYQESYPLDPYSLVFSRSGTTIRLRVSAPIPGLATDPASRFSIVTWQQCVTGKGEAAYSWIRREQRMASGREVPGTRVKERIDALDDVRTWWPNYRRLARLEHGGVRQYLELEVNARGGAAGKKQPSKTFSRLFEIPVPPAPLGAPGGPKGFAQDFPASTWAGQLAGGLEIVGPPGNVDPLEPPPDRLVDGKPEDLVPGGQEAERPNPFERVDGGWPPKRTLFLHAAVARLEKILGSTFHGDITGSLADPANPQGPRQSFVLRAYRSVPVDPPLAMSLDLAFRMARRMGPSAVAELIELCQLESVPGLEMSLIDAARILIGEGGR
jgi:hypothetical protein